MAGKRANGEHSVYKSGGRWHVQGWLGGQRVRVSAKTQAEAKARWQSRQADAALTGQLSIQSITGVLGTGALTEATVAEVLHRWFELNQHRWAYSTRVGYRRSIAAHLVPYLGELQAKELDVVHVELWQHQLQQTGLANSTIRQARVALRQAIDMCVRYRQLPVNRVPLAQTLPKTKAKPDHLSAAEAAAVLRAATDPVQHARWLLALTLGMRSGEVLALRWDDVTLDGPTPRLVINGSLQRQTEAGLVRVAPKTPHSNRALLLAPAHVAALRQVKVTQARQALASRARYNAGGYVFTTDIGTPIDSANDMKAWHALLETAGVRRVRRHDARHTAATLLLASGAGLAAVQRVLGHAQISTTGDYYAHLSTEDCSTYTAKITDTLLSEKTRSRGA